MQTLNTKNIHPSWLPLVKKAMAELDPAYIHELEQHTDWLPGPELIFNAFTAPLSSIHYILFGESPYPRALSANGFAFWDAAVRELWSPKGLSGPVNRATSLRNLIKMLFVAEGKLTLKDTSQAAIAAIDKSPYVATLDELFQNLQKKGFLLLNASLVYRKNNVPKDALAWRPFMAKILEQLAKPHPDLELILFGKVAQLISNMPSAKAFKQFRAEHPYNISFISNKDVLNFFRPLKLLKKS